MQPKVKTVDGNEAVAYVAYRLNEIISIYPITPSTSMGEFSDAWSAAGVKNLWGTVPLVTEMQSEGGAAGAIHGSLQTGALATTFTASQGLLLMIPNMYRIAGELNATVFHVAARALAAATTSIYGDHSDVMATRTTGFAMLSARSVQEAHDMALIAQAASLEGRIPVLHFFDGFRTSHEVAKIEYLSDEQMRAMISPAAVHAHRRRALSPEHPFIRGTVQNADVCFQEREAVNSFYLKFPEVIQHVMDRFAGVTGRAYHLFEYAGAEDAERVIVCMGSGAETVEETVRWMNAHGEKVGALTVHVYRPFSVKDFLGALPKSVKQIAVLDRTKEAGSAGEPLYLDVVAALGEGFHSKTAPFAELPRVIGGRYGLASKEFTPAMVKSIFAELQKTEPKNHFTIGIVDDVTHTSLEYDPTFSIEEAETIRCGHTLKAFLEAEAYEGPSLIIAYTHCIAHGYDMRNGLEQQRLASMSGTWPLYRYNPSLIGQGKNPLVIDSKEPSIPVEKYAYNEERYRMLIQSNEARAEALMRLANEDAKRRWRKLRQIHASWSE